MDIQMETVPKISANVKTRPEQFGLLVVSKRTPILALNKDSAMLWECIDGKSSVEEIAVRLEPETEGGSQEIVDTVKCFIESCLELGLIEI